MDTQEPGHERRRYKRRYIQFSVRYRLNVEGVIREWRETEAGNVSAGGLFMTFGETLHVGRVMDLEFVVPGRSAPILARGTIVWARNVVPNTMVECGLEFSEINPEDKAFLDAFASQ
ncbi:MAG: PilZ domain-containing protein [Elusimicrobia bacterium]|nr:PilZ domain-containing protein [Elusimicrobiota bacterium]